MGESVEGCDSLVCLCFHAEDGIRDLVRSRGLGDVYKRQRLRWTGDRGRRAAVREGRVATGGGRARLRLHSDALSYLLAFVGFSLLIIPVSYTHLTLPTIYSV